MSIFRKYERNELRKKGLLSSKSTHDRTKDESIMDAARRADGQKYKKVKQNTPRKKFRPKHIRKKV